MKTRKLLFLVICYIYLSNPVCGQSLPTGKFPEMDELFFSVATLGYRYSSIMYTKKVNGVWSEPEINIHYLGHSSFLIDFDNEITVLTDYGKPNAWLDYGWDSPIHSIGMINPDISTYSHLHEDHCDFSRIDTTKTRVYQGVPDAFCFKDLKIQAIPTSEKDIMVSDNNSYLIEYKGIRILHMGDCQADIMAIDEPEHRASFLEQIPDDLDILIFPIEGTEKYLLQAVRIVKETRAKIYIPSHYWSKDYKNEFLKACNESGNLTVSRIKENRIKFGTIGAGNIKTIIDMHAAGYSNKQDHRNRKPQ